MCAGGAVCATIRPESDDRIVAVRLAAFSDDSPDVVFRVGCGRLPAVALDAGAEAEEPQEPRDRYPGEPERKGEEPRHQLWSLPMAMVTRRFFWRPASLVFGAIGSASPFQAILRRADGIPCPLSQAVTVVARRCERPRL